MYVYILLLQNYFYLWYIIAYGMTGYQHVCNDFVCEW